MSSRSAGSTFTICTAFITLPLLLLTIVDGVSATAALNTTTAAVDGVTTATTGASRNTTPRLVYRVSTFPPRQVYRFTTVPPRRQPLFTTRSYRYFPLPARTTVPRALWSWHPVVRTSRQPVYRTTTRRRPVVITTQPRQSIVYVTSAPMTIAGGEVINCHVKLANVYKEMLNGSQTSGHIYGLELGPRIAGMCYIDATRISDVDVLEHPETGRMVLKFSINPPVKSCRIGCFFDTSRVARRIKDLVDSHSFSLSDINWRTLYADQLPAFYSWTDRGPCPNKTCPVGDVCNARASGELYCQCVTNCPALGVVKDGDDLFALFVIPVVVIVVLVILLIMVIRKRREYFKKKIGVKTVRDYKPAYDIETLKKQPMLATLDPHAASQLAQNLECQLGIAFNQSSFDNASCISEAVTSPLSTIRVGRTPGGIEDNHYE